MKTKLSILLLGCLVLVLNPLALYAGTSSIITEGKSNDIMYATGGVGEDERMEIDAMAKDYNVKMVFVEAPRYYVSGVMVKIEDYRGKVLLETTSSGPWFFAKLPQGDYRFIASFHDHQEIKNLNVASGHETVEFFWRA
jgi:hypothetical protein